MKRFTLVFPCVFVLAFAPVKNAFSQWTTTNGTYFSVVKCFAHDGLSLFAGGNTGVFRSTDHGRNWAAIDTSIGTKEVEALAVSRGTLFAGTFGGGVFRSTDDGTSWRTSSQGLTDTNIRCLTLKDTILFAGTDHHGIFRSDDGGSSWYSVGKLLANSGVVSLLVSGSNLYAGSANGVYFSADNGAVWKETQLKNLLVWSMVATDTNIFAGTESGCFRSGDGGETWTETDNGLGNTEIHALGYDGVFLIALTQHGIFRSSDAGTHWTDANRGMTDYLYPWYAMMRVDSVLFVGGEAGIFRSQDRDINWTPSNNTLGYLSTYSLLAEDSAIFAGTVLGIFRSTDNGENWTATSAGLTNYYVKAFCTHGSTLFAGTQGGLCRTVDLGEHWSQTQLPLSDSSITCLVAHEPFLFAGCAAQGVVRSSDDGLSWTVVNTGLSPWARNTHTLLESNSNLYLGTEDGVYVSRDEGIHWFKSSSGLTSLSVYGISVLDNILFAATSSGMFRSSDQGADWEPAGMQQIAVEKLLSTREALYAVSDHNGIFRSSDHGANWNMIGMVDPHAYCVASNGSDLLSGAFGSGVWRRPLSDFDASVTPPIAIQDNLSIWPNPTNGIASIRDSSGSVNRIELIDLLGTNLFSLVNPHAEVMQIDLSKSPAGIYLLRISMPGSEMTRTIVKQ